MTPRDAATVLLVRDGAAGVEALLMRRAAASPFMPDLCVFAGGRVDDADRDPGLADGGTAFAPFAVAAIREALEEAGVALVRGPAAARASLVAQRTAVAKGAVSLAAALAALDLRPDFDALVPFAHWVTPLFETRRYNTLFFAALATVTSPRSMDTSWSRADGSPRRTRSRRPRPSRSSSRRRPSVSCGPSPHSQAPPT